MAFEIDLDLASDDAEFAILHAIERGAMRRAARTECEVVAELGFRLLGRWTLDLSTDGLLLDSGAPVLVGEAVYVSLKLPRSTQWIDAEGHVARAVDGQRAGDCGTALGVRFERMDGIDRALLAAALQGLPPVLPRRPRRMDYAATVAALSWAIPPRAAAPVF